MAGIGIVSNPHSKLNRRNPKRSEYLSYIAGKQGHVAITKSIDELSKVAQMFKEQQISILAINGGDGTISQTLTIFHAVYQGCPFPKVALLRGGTMNVLASNLRIKGAPEQILYRLIEQHSTGALMKTVMKSSLQVGEHLGFLFAHGTPAQFLERFYRNKKGGLGAAWMILGVVMSRFFYQSYYKQMVTYTPTDVVVDNQEKISQSTIAILISTLPQMPMGPRLFPAVVDPDHPEVDLRKAQLVSYAVEPLKASLKVPVDAFCLSARDTALKTRAVGQKFAIHARPPEPYTVDGELFYPKKKDLTVAVGPSFEFIVV